MSIHITDEREYGRRKKKKFIILIAIIAAAVVAYIVVSLYFSRHFMPNTTVNGVNASGKTAAAVEKELKSEVPDYRITLKERNNKTETINGTDLGIQPAFGNKIEQAQHSQPAFSWIVTAWRPKTVTVTNVATYNESALNAKLNSLNCMKKSQMTESENATVSEKQTGGKFTIVKEVYGTQINDAAFRRQMKRAASSLVENVDLSKSGCYVDPKYTSSSPEVKKALDKVTKLTDMKVTYDMKDIDPVVVGPNEIRKMITIDNNMNVSISRQKVAEYVDAFAKKYNTAYTVRRFKTYTGKTVKVMGGYYGWRLNQDKETASLYKELLAGKNVSRKPYWTSTAVSHKKKEYGNTYIEVDLSQQTVWLIKKGKCVFTTSCVSGNVSEGKGTTPGMYAVAYKQRHATLKGANYQTPVSYWMPFNDGQGFHDAYWRGAFGGSIYKTDGSHGCVNLPTYAAAALYSKIDAGIPVIIYYS